MLPVWIFQVHLPRCAITHTDDKISVEKPRAFAPKGKAALTPENLFALPPLYTAFLSPCVVSTTMYGIYCAHYVENAHRSDPICFSIR